MIVKYNGKYTQAFLEAFTKAYNQKDTGIFMNFCITYQITCDEKENIINILNRQPNT